MRSALSSLNVDERVVEPEAVDLAGLFRAHARYVAGVAMRLLGNDAEVDDVVQDVFITASSKLHTLREPEAIRGWLATIAVRIASRRLRWRRLRRVVQLGEWKAAAPLYTTDIPADERVLLTSIYALLDKLPTAVRVAWTLRYIEGEGLDEVARLCECSLATAKRRIAAAQLSISEVFSDE